MKRLLALIFALMMLASLMAGCGKTKTNICSICGKEYKVSAKFEPKEGWIYYCNECDASMAEMIAK